MKKLHLVIALLSSILFSCGDPAKIDKNPIIEQVNLLGPESNTKYEVKLRTQVNSKNTYMYTNFKYQVGDTLISFMEYFESRLKPVTDSLSSYKLQNEKLLKENEGLRTYTKFLESKILEEKLKIDLK